MLANAFFVVAVICFIGTGIYTIAVPICCFYDLTFPPAERLGWKRVPRPVVLLGIGSFAVFVAIVLGGFIIIAVSKMFSHPAT